MSEEQLKKLIELKKELESKKMSLERELELINLNLSIINSAISERSFVTADTLLKAQEEASTKEEQVPEPITRIEEKPKIKPIRTEKILDVDGYLLATMNIYEDNRIDIIPNSELKFKEDISPFKNFLIKKVFEGKKSSDIESGKSVDKSFDYSVKKDEEGNIIEINLKNVAVNDSQEMKNLNGSIKWTLKRIREKIKMI